MSKVRRKPPPAFPYSPRYPLPDPSDPFVPLKVLRERAQSSNASLTTPYDDSCGFLPGNDAFLLTATPDVIDISRSFETTYPSNSGEHETRQWQEQPSGYQSDSPRPLRPPRSRVRPARESKLYFSDVDLPSAPLHRRQDQTHQPRRDSKPADQYHYRRRSQSVFVLPRSLSNGPSPTAEAPPSNAGATPHLSADVDVAVPSTQYTYDDRQSHGYVYTQESDLNTQPSSHHESTPPMTPDDTMSLSGSSARDRSVSQSPGSLFRDLPKRVSKPALSREREPRADHAQGSRAGIQSADFPILLVPSRTPSPAAIPPHPQTETESDREHTTSRTRTESLSKRNSAHNRLRKTSATKGSRGSLRQRKLSNASLRRVARKTSTASESSLSVPQVRVTNGVESTTTAGAESNPGVGSKFTKFLMPKKSLSHVSLGLTPLPNVSLGSPMMQSANTSMGSAITVSATPVFPKDSELSQLQSRLPVRESIVVDPETVPHSRRLTQPVMDLDTPVDTDTIADLIAELRPQVHIEEVEGDDDDDVETYTAMTTLTRPLSPVRSRSPDDRTNAARISHFSVMQRTPSPPQHSRALPVPPPRAPSAVPDPSLLPAPRSESPAQFYRSSTPRNTEVPMPAPLPISPPHHDASECPTPLPLPPSPRAASPAPPLLQSRLEDPLPSRPKTPPQEPRSRRREGSKEEDRQSAYLPVAQLRPQSQALTQLEAHPEHPQSHNQLQMVGRTRTANSSNAPARRSTVAPLVQVQPPRLQSPPGQAPPRRQSPAAEQQYRAQSPSVHLPFRPQSVQGPSQTMTRTQSPPPHPVQQNYPYRQQSAPMQSSFRTHSPPLPQPPLRMKAPHAHTYPRAQSPPPTSAPVRRQSPIPQGHGGSSQSHGGFSQLSRSGTGMSAAPQSTPAPQPRHAGTAPSTPLPEYTASSSPLFSAQSYPHTSLRSHADMRAPARSKAPQRVPMIPFDEHAMPTPEQLEHAASLVVVAQSGLRVPFGDLFRIRRTIVIFIRHFWCPLCQDYMSSVTRAVDPEELKRAGVDLVFIGNGSPGMIKSYRQIFHTPFAIYTDPTLRLHAALGMTRRTTDPGPESEKGAYTQHGLISGIAMVVRNALRVGMPVWEKGGDVAQLGGEFVLGPGLDCTFAHRMRTTRSHEPIMTVLAAAGVRSLTFGGDDAARSVLYPEDEDAWMAHRRRSLARLHARREGRRRGTGKRSLEAWCGDECELPYGSDVDGGSVSGCWGSSAREPSEDAAERRARRLHAAGPNANANAHPYTDMGRQGAPRLPPEAHEMYGAHVWEGGVPDLTLMENYGQTDGEPYRLTREVLAYSFGKA